MNTYTTHSNIAADFTIDYASAITSGYGHKEITVSVNYEGKLKNFTATTSNMHAYDQATDLEGQEKYEALYELVEGTLNDQISEWIYHEKA